MGSNQCSFSNVMTRKLKETEWKMPLKRTVDVFFVWESPLTPKTNGKHKKDREVLYFRMTFIVCSKNFHTNVYSKIY